MKLRNILSLLLVVMLAVFVGCGSPEEVDTDHTDTDHTDTDHTDTDDADTDDADTDDNDTDHADTDDADTDDADTDDTDTDDTDTDDNDTDDNDNEVPVTFTLTVNAENGTVTINPEKTAYDENEGVTLTAAPAEDYAFDGWTVGSEYETANPLTLTMTTDTAVTAVFISMSDGSIKVTTNIVPDDEALVYPASVVVTDNSGTEVATGETGADGSVTFADITPGDYTVTVTWMYLGSEAAQAAPVTVSADTESPAALSFPVPELLVVELVLRDYLLDGRPDQTEVEFPFTIVESGFYLFELKEYDGFAVDAVLELYDANGGLIAEGDDVSHSRVATFLGEGDYKLSAKSADGSTAVVALLDVGLLTPIY